MDFASFGRFLAQGGAILDRSLDPAEAPVFALNSAFVRDGAVIRIRHGAKLARPLEIAHVFAGDKPGLQTLRHQVTVGAGRGSHHPADLLRPGRRRPTTPTW